MAKQYDVVVKLLLVGDSGVGKTCMIQRFANHNFRKDYHSTIGLIIYFIFVKFLLFC